MLANCAKIKTTLLILVDNKQESISVQQMEKRFSQLMLGFALKAFFYYLDHNLNNLSLLSSYRWLNEALV